jgi:hypothetical protein
MTRCAVFDGSRVDIVGEPQYEHAKGNTNYADAGYVNRPETAGKVTHFTSLIEVSPAQMVAWQLPKNLLG